MFEKDEDYRKARKESKDKITKVIKFWSAREETLHDKGFQKGAEFGYNKANEQLTKAKELLKQLVDIEYAVNIPKDKIISLRVKAEQFLSEVEK